jgi:uncharacterized C2H2 Zn-finger protein
MKVYQCPNTDMIFGGNDLTVVKIHGVKKMQCPICGEFHRIDKNHQLLGDQENGTKTNESKLSGKTDINWNFKRHGFTG